MGKYRTKPSKEYRDAVSRAFCSNDFSKLNSLINNTDVVVLEQVKVKQEKDVKQILESKQLKQELSEVEITIQKGYEYISKIRALNDLIPGELISKQMEQMELLLDEIFKRLKECPNKISKVQKLMNYYLPTTIKLLQSYFEFDEIKAANSDVENAKTEIEKTMDKINEAFTELLRQLLQENAFDVITDAQVFQTMLAKDGLTKNDIILDGAKSEEFFGCFHH